MHPWPLAPSLARTPSIGSPRIREDSIHVAPLASSWEMGRTHGIWVPPGVAHSQITPLEASWGKTVG